MHPATIIYNFILKYFKHSSTLKNLKRHLYLYYLNLNKFCIEILNIIYIYRLKNKFLLNLYIIKSMFIDNYYFISPNYLIVHHKKNYI